MECSLTAGESGLRVLLFTDTLGDVNGVSRFVLNAAACARSTGRDLRVLTSTNFRVPAESNILNFPPRAAMRMPEYENLELALPPVIRMLRAVRALRPDAIHISTPGPVGLVGLLAARRMGVPILGTYHTDFPAYIERLFGNDSLAWMSRGVMRAFYGPFRVLFSRSEGYIEAIAGLGIDRARCVRLRPGIALDQFGSGFRDVAAMALLCGSPPGRIRVLYVGRVSVEKNLPMLARAWATADAELKRRGVDAELVVVGDGPYLAAMREELRGRRAVFLGFRHGPELAMCYAGCDLFAFPSTTDTLGQVVMEAQASGLPVLVTDEGGPKEIVRDGVTGMVLRADTGVWSKEMTALACDGERRGAMGDAAAGFMAGFPFERSFEHWWGVHEAMVLGLRADRGRVPSFPV